MKRFNLLLALFLLCQAVWAQNPERRISIDQKMEKLNQELKLSETQQEEFRRILTTQEKQMEALRKDGKALRDSIHKIHQESHQQLKAVLTAEQVAAFEELKKTHPPKHAVFNKQRIHEYHSARSTFEEMLTSEERIQIDSARKIRNEIAEIRKGENSEEDMQLNQDLRKQIHHLLQPVVEHHKAELTTTLESLEENHPMPEQEPKGNKQENRRYYMFLMME